MEGSSMSRKLQELMKNDLVKAIVDSAETPSAAHLSFVPTPLKDKVLDMSAVDLDRSAMLTLVLGITGSSYSKSMWKEDIQKWGNVFVNSHMIDIPLKGLSDLPKVLDAAHAIEVTSNALTYMSDVPENSPVRMILIGPGLTQFTFEAIEHLLKRWERPTSQKRLNLILSGDPEEKFFKFCRQLCLKGACHSIQLYDTMNYHPFGYYKEDSIKA